MKVIRYIVFLLCLISCGASKEEEVDGAKTSAENFLTLGQCNDALDVLNGVGYQNEDSDFLKLYASAYACRTDYLTTTFFADDITKIDTDNLLSSLTTFTYSTGSEGSGSTDYINMQTAIDTLLYAGGLSTAANPSSVDRSDYFSSSDLAEINSLALYLVLNQLGAYSYFYGNTNATGVKGAGDASENSVCFFSYDVDGGGSIDTAIDSALSGNGGSCTGTGLQGKSELTSGGEIDVEAACEGIVLINNFRDLLANVALGSISDVDLTDVDSYFEDAFDSLSAAGISFDDSTIITVKSQEKCEDDFATNYRDLQIYFAFIFELLHNKS